MTTATSIPSSKAISEILRTVQNKEARGYASAFRKQHAIDQDDGWKLLAQIFDFHFRPSNAAEPFGPMAQFDNKRSMIPDDLTDEQIERLRATLGEVDDPEFRARIADVLWVRKRDAAAARSAVDLYIQAGTRLEDPEHWTRSIERYERAIRLARQIEPKGQLSKKALGHLEGRVLHYDGVDPLYFTLKSLELLNEFGFGDSVKLAEIAGRVAQRSRTAGDYRKARSHFDVQARLLVRAKDAAGAEAARVALAECFAEEADAQENSGSFMAARIYWEKALTAFRDRPSLRSKIPELRKRLAVAGEKTLDEMKVHSVELDLAEQAAASKAAIAGLQRDDAFFRYVSLIPLIDPEALRRESIELIEKHPLQSIIEATIFDAAGRKIGVRPSAFTEDKEQYESAVAGFMEQNARFYREPNVIGCLAPALRQMLAEHEIDEFVIESLVGDRTITAPT